MSSPRRGTRRAREAGEEPEEPGPARQVPRPNPGPARASSQENRFVETQSDAAYAAYQTVESVRNLVLEDGDEPGAALFFLVIMAKTAFSARMEARERVGSDPVQKRNDDGSLRFTEDGIGAFRKWNKAVRDSRKTAERTCEQRSAARTALRAEIHFQIAKADERHPTPSGTLRPYTQQRASLGTGAEIPKNLSGPALAAAQAESEGTSTCGICAEHMDGSFHHDANNPMNSYDRLPGRLACGCTKYCMGCIRKDHKAADDAALRQHRDPPSHYRCPARCAEASIRGVEIPYEVLDLEAGEPSQEAILRAIAGIAYCPSVSEQMERSGVPTVAELAARSTFPITNAAMRTEQESRDPAYMRRLCVPGKKPVYEDPTHVREAQCGTMSSEADMHATPESTTCKVCIKKLKSTLHDEALNAFHKMLEAIGETFKGAMTPQLAFAVNVMVRDWFNEQVRKERMPASGPRGGRVALGLEEDAHRGNTKLVGGGTLVDPAEIETINRVAAFMFSPDYTFAHEFRLRFRTALGERAAAISRDQDPVKMLCALYNEWLAAGKVPPPAVAAGGGE